MSASSFICTRWAKEAAANQKEEEEEGEDEEEGSSGRAHGAGHDRRRGSPPCSRRRGRLSQRTSEEEKSQMRFTMRCETSQSDGLLPWARTQYMSDRLERLSSPQTDCVENDPFWQRWETAADPESPDPDSPHAKSPANPLAAALTPNLPKDNLPLPLNLEEQQNPTASPSSTSPRPSLVSPPASVGGLFHALVSLLLRLVLSFILLILPSEEMRMGPHQPRGPNKRGSGSSGTAGRRRPTLIEPERLKDFGEEDLLNGDVKVWEAPRVSGPPEIQLMEPPKTRRLSEFKARAKPSTDYLRFEDISAAAFKIQSAIQKTPCTYSRLSKQYGMEIYLKKEHLHYTGSVKERGVLYLLTSLTQKQQKKGVIVATDCNFSMAVAHHAVELRIPVFVIMPACCSPPRFRLYRDYGAMVISYGIAAQDARNHARHLAKNNGYLYLEEDEQAAYLAGLGTVGMEIYEQVPKLDAVVVPASGQFGLLSGTAAALKHLNSRILVVSLKTGEPVKDMTSRPNSKLYGDLAEHSLGLHSFQLVKKHVDKVVTVSEENSLVAMLRFQEFERSTVDTEGAMGLAAILAGQLPELRGKRKSSSLAMSPGRLPSSTVNLLMRSSSTRARSHTLVECVVETRDKTQSMQLRKTLCERYPSLCWLDR
ncbi:hypothetical protein CRUP_035535 [Coryphaenoides rupestris]|nr:hypothetical protein CRUP_035535 [Coryphaenoides rupestris]